MDAFYMSHRPLMTRQGAVFGTTVRNPLTSQGRDEYTKCRWCQKWYTRLGISRHWDRCLLRRPAGS